MDLLGVEYLIEIRQLYLDRRYKQCISACEKVLGQEIHPVHRTFLLFHQAVSQEALGMAAHQYSNNKIPFLESAKIIFERALQTLPQPYIPPEQDGVILPNHSPSLSSFEPSTPVGLNLLQACNQPYQPQHIDINITDSSDSNSYSSEDTVLITPTENSFDLTPRISSQTNHMETDNTFDRSSPCPGDKGNEQTPTMSQGSINHKARLSQSVSNGHVVVDELIPSPLFSRNKKIAIVSYETPQTPTDIQHEQIPEDPEKPLPTLPFFKSQPTFALRNGRHVLVPKEARPPITPRKSAIQTLIAKFEGTIPSSPVTPITPRFNFIRDTFAHDSIGANTPVPNFPLSKTKSQQKQYMSSVSTARYNTALTSTRTQILYHLKCVETNIEEARRIQNERATRRRPVQNDSTRGMGPRMASYWMLQPTQNSSSRRSNVRSRDLYENDGEAAAKKMQRIEKLRQQGFRVSKEQHGWKGDSHYAELRKRTEAELDV